MTYSATSGRLVRELRVTPVVHTDSLEDAEVRKGEGLGRALLVEAVSTVPTVVLSVGKRERRSAPHTDIRVNPFGRLASVSVRASSTGTEKHTALLSIMLLATVTRGGNWKPSRCSVLYTSPIYPSS